MATIKAARAISSSAALRQKPFTPISRPASSRAAVRVRAAEVEAAEDLDFQFSYSDAKKNNEYSSSDVEAALRFYIDGEGSAPIHDADFVTNTLGMEDASFFDDIDNNEGYEEDEYLVAGIPEAAPKKRRDGRRGQGAADEGDDDLEQAKALDKVKALEDRMVLEAALEEEYGDASTASTRADAKAKGVWDWLLDGTEGGDFTDAQAVMAASRPSVSLVSDNEVAADMARVNPEVFEQSEVRDYLELFANDDLSEEVLAAASTTDDGNYPDSSITDADISRLDAVIKTAVPDLAVSELAPNTVRLLGDDGDLDAATVDNYIEALRSAFKGGNSEDEVKALFGDAPLTEEAPEPLDTSKEYKELLAFKAEDIPAVDLDLSAVDEVVAAAEEDEDDEGFEAELRSLAAIEVFRPEDLPSAEELELADQFLNTAEDYVAQDEARKAQIAAAVARGELSPDSLAEELEVLADAEAELLAMEDDGDLDDIAVEDEDDGEQWVERIIEMTRVTKVVKGGKIMGFRCVAIVGNQKGLVGVGCAAGREIAVAVKRTLVDAKKNLVYVPLVGEDTIPHRAESKFHAGRVVLVPASGGTGCIAGGVVRSVLELAGVKNCLSKRLGSRSPLNTARATVKALGSVQTLEQVSASRGVPMAQLLQLA